MRIKRKWRHNNRKAIRKIGQLTARRIKVITFLLVVAIGLAVGLNEKNADRSNNGNAIIESKTDENNTGPLTSNREGNRNDEDNAAPIKPVSATDFDVTHIPSYSSAPYIEINCNVPFFSDDDIAKAYKSFEYYSPLDELGRCGMAVASVGVDLMPTAERGDIGMIRPTGWHTVRYDEIVEGKYLYNRCHLIGYQLCGENSNIENLITGTRELNTIGMLPFEDMIADYVQETRNHVLYRVTPMFEGENLLATGVLMEACSVEDGGETVRFNVFCYNSQPGISIDYLDGSSKIIADKEPQLSKSENPPPTQAVESTQANEQTYILNKNTKRFHYPWCASVDNMAEKTKLRQQNLEIA